MQIAVSSTPGTLEEKLLQVDLDTPAFIYDLTALDRRAQHLSGLARDAGVQLLYAMKANSFVGILDALAPAVDGFATSSAFETQLIQQIAAARHSIHITNPGLRPNEFEQINNVCDYILFNSLPQWERYGRSASKDTRCGLRINPELSLVDDVQYDPCCSNSKLGVPISYIRDHTPEILKHLGDVSGLHFHTNCEAQEFSGLLETCERIAAQAKPMLEHADWINIGGGYLFLPDDDMADFRAAMDLLKDQFQLDVFMEPGSAFLHNACYLASTVVDIFDSGGKQIAILDTSVNHWPDVFEYKFAPETILGTADGPHEYILAGSTCLAGDLFGTTHRFAEPLTVGARVVFTNAGAYSLVRANYFNGLNLPKVYACSHANGQDFELSLRKDPAYPDFARHSGAN